MDAETLAIFGGGALFPAGPFQASRETFDDGWTPDEPDQRELRRVTIERALGRLT